MKIKSRDEIKSIRFDALKAKKVGYTTGSFDLFHAGHADYLQKAREYCDVLIVGVNSNLSVQRYKDPRRPIIDEKFRVEVLAALECVDFVFQFDDTNNNTNITELKPDLYIKAGDYKKSELTSAPLVEAYGGEVVIIPVVHEISTTKIVESVIARYATEVVSLDSPPKESSPAVFVDRDGTINEHVDYLSEPEKFKLIPGAIDGLKILKELGYRIVVVTNQPGIGLGYFSKEDFYAVNRVFLTEAYKAGLLVDKVYFCPHSVSEKCACRKPNTALVDRAVSELNIDLKKSYVIGDSEMDVKLAKNIGCKGIYVQSGRKDDRDKDGKDADFVVPDLKAAAELLAKEEGLLNTL